MENYEDIDIKRILKIAFSKKLLIILILLFSITLGYVYSYYYKKPEYQSSVKILLVADENKEDKELTQTDLNINSSLISTYSNIAKSTNVLEKTISNLGLNMSADELQKNVTAKQIDTTQFLKITVTNSNPETAKNIANELANVFTEQIKEIYNIQNISIVDPAEVENTPSNVNHAKDMIIAVAGGVFASIVMVMIVYMFDDTIKSPKDIEETVKIRSIGSLPLNKDKEKLIAENNPKSNIVEGIKTLRTNILYSTNKKTILITSCKGQEGKTFLANNLSVAFAQAGKKTLLINTNLREESQNNEIFELEKSEGLSDYIKEVTDNKITNIEKSEKYIKETKIPNLYMLENGTLPPNPSELISSNNMKMLIESLKEMFDLIVLDGTPCLTIADSIALSSMVDGTILIAESKKTQIGDLKKAKKLIEDVNGHILGAITNKVEIQKGKYYGKKYQYYYGYGDKPEISEKSKDEEKIIPLTEIIEEAKSNIKEENKRIKIEQKHEEKIEKLEENQEEIEKNNAEIYKEQISYEVNNLKVELLTELNKIKNTKTEEKINQITENVQELSNQLKENKENYKNTIEEINEKLTSNKEEYNNTVEEINEKLTSNKEEYNNTVEKINNQLANSKENYKNIIDEINNQLSNNKDDYKNIVAELNNKLEDGREENIQVMKYFNNKLQDNKEDNAREIEYLNDKIMNNHQKYLKIAEDINYKLEDNQEEYVKAIENINDKLNDLNEAQEQYSKSIETIKTQENENVTMAVQQFITEVKSLKNEIDNLKQIQSENNKDVLEKIENISADVKAQTEMQVQNQQEEKQEPTNIISFEELKEQRKRVFSIDEDIRYEDLERLSTCVVDLDKDVTTEVAFN